MSSVTSLGETMGREWVSDSVCLNAKGKCKIIRVNVTFLRVRVLEYDYRHYELCYFSIFNPHVRWNVLLSRPPLHPGAERLPVDISAQKNRCHSSVSHRYTVSLWPLTNEKIHATITIKISTPIYIAHSGLPQSWKACTSLLFLAPVLPHRWPCCSPGLPPPAHPHTILSLKGQQLHLRRASSQSCYTLSVPPLLSPPRWAWSHTQHTTFLGSFFTFISSVCSLNSTCPLLALFPFFALSLFLQTPHYPLSAFLILSLISHCLSRPNLPLFTASVHLLPPFAHLHFFILLTSVKPHIVSLSGVLPSNEKMQEINWLIAEWMWH